MNFSQYFILAISFLILQSCDKEKKEKENPEPTKPAFSIATYYQCVCEDTIYQTFMGQTTNDKKNYSQLVAVNLANAADSVFNVYSKQSITDTSATFVTSMGLRFNNGQLSGMNSASVDHWSIQGEKVIISEGGNALYYNSYDSSYRPSIGYIYHKRNWNCNKYQ